MPGDEQLRITFDREGAAARYDGCLRPQRWIDPQFPAVVLELKFTDRFPVWMRDLAQSWDLYRTKMGKYVLCVDGIPKNTIVAFTFTERAAEEMKFRIRTWIQKVTPSGEEVSLGNMYIGTIHGFCLAKLREFWPDDYHNFDILVDDQVVGMMNRKFQLRDRYVLDLSGDHERKLDRRVAVALAVGLDTLQNR